ncbi:hypothetical protein IW261DRAFT_1614153 [Armillaria novae-zelandiae]|uniref:Uncharacterized protein n=1 Tax=Armillaria novae-zelandiae TaxID=153914 RepID=A0AA39N9K7_9AGAR|nr:hypothetical protein IW261DRAFT_1614153 [Armillaria novae-zelandiae]
MYTNESYRMKATRKYGKTERKIVKVHWTPSQSNVKERDGCCQYTHVWRDQKTVYGYAIRERVLLSEAGMHRRMRRGIYSSGGLRCLLYCRVGTKNLTRTRVIKSVCAVKVDEARTGRCKSSTRNTLAETRAVFTFPTFLSLSTNL